MVKFAAYVPELVASSIETVYFYNPNMAFKQCAHRLSSTIRIFSHIKVTILQQFSYSPPPSPTSVPLESVINKALLL